jgi:calcium-dependent protein kinase
MGGCCNKRDNMAVTTRRGSTASRKGSIFIEKISKLEDYKRKYEYISMLGNGGFGKVRLYRDRHVKELKFAIKTLKKDYLNENNIKSLRDEVQILAQLDHPNIVKYFETFEDDFYIHIVMEYIPGDNLFKVVTNKKYNHFTEKDAAIIIKFLLKAVMFLHKNKIVHRDIKPENILFSVPGDWESLKLIDFGLSATKMKQKEKYRVGSPYYMAPEMIEGDFHFETDIWSIGVILYVMMTGKQPFTGKSKEEIFQKIGKGVYDVSLLDTQKCSEEVKDFIKKLLVLDYRRRLSVPAALEHDWITVHSGETNINTVVDTNILESLKTFCNSNPLQKEILFYLAKISSESEIHKLKQAFMRIDKDNTGTIEVDEMVSVFEQMGLKRSKVSISLILGRN